MQQGSYHGGVRSGPSSQSTLRGPWTVDRSVGRSPANCLDLSRQVTAIVARQDFACAKRPQPRSQVLRGGQSFPERRAADAACQDAACCAGPERGHCLGEERPGAFELTVEPESLENRREKDERRGATQSKKDPPARDARRRGVEQ